MEFRLIQENEKNIILDLYNYDRASTLTAWDETYPTIDNINNDIKYHNLYCLVEDNKIIGSIAINSENELDNEAPFSNPKALEFGRVIIHPSYRGKGYAKLLLHYIEQEVISRGYKAIHICVYANSNIALSMYRSFGYKEVCKKQLFDYPFVLFEKDLSK